MKRDKASKPVVAKEHTYLIDGVVMTQPQALSLLHKDGTGRYVLLDPRVGELPGTLACRANPMKRLHSRESSELSFVARRKAEGHWGGRSMQFGHFAQSAEGSGLGSRESN